MPEKFIASGKQLIVGVAVSMGLWDLLSPSFGNISIFLMSDLKVIATEANHN